MTLDELVAAMGKRFERSRLAYNQRDLKEFCDYWFWRMRREKRQRSLEALASKFRDHVRTLIDQRTQQH